MARGLAPAVCSLLVSTSPAFGQRPTKAEAAAMIARSREKALAYARSLPDFVCSEVIRRYSENHTRTFRSRSVAVPALSRWTPTDKLTVRLSYFQQKEEHKLVSVNDKPTELKYESLAGGTGEGEFGGTLLNIFGSSATVFKWDSWKTVKRHRVAVYKYTVDAAHSHYMVANGAVGDTHEAIVGFHGDLEIDRMTGEVLHFTYVADQIPKEVTLDKVSTTVDYDLAEVAGRNYLLPVHSETEIFSPGLSVRNDMDFREYRKFSAESVIDFIGGK